MGGAKKLRNAARTAGLPTGAVCSDHGPKTYGLNEALRTLVCSGVVVAAARGWEVV